MIVGAPASEIAKRVHATAIILAERGYCGSADLIARLCVGGALAPSEVERAAREDPRLRVVDGEIVPIGDSRFVAASRARQDAHAAQANTALRLAHDYAKRLRQRCPHVRVILVSGSLASGGYDAVDDIDISLVVDDGTKHLSYVHALMVALPFAWYNRRSRASPSTRVGILRKVICVNAVWTRSETTPFVRTDDKLGLELMLHTPIWGEATWRAIMRENPHLTARFPQLVQGPGPTIDPFTTTPHRRARRNLPILDWACYHFSRGLHLAVRASRWRHPEVRARVARLEATKHPYAILDRPQRKSP